MPLLTAAPRGRLRDNYCYQDPYAEQIGTVSRAVMYKEYVRFERQLWGHRHDGRANVLNVGSFGKAVRALFPSAYGVHMLSAQGYYVHHYTGLRRKPVSERHGGRRAVGMATPPTAGTPRPTPAQHVPPATAAACAGAEPVRDGSATATSAASGSEAGTSAALPSTPRPVDGVASGPDGSASPQQGEPPAVRSPSNERPASEAAESTLPAASAASVPAAAAHAHAEPAEPARSVTVDPLALRRYQLKGRVHVSDDVFERIALPTATTEPLVQGVRLAAALVLRALAREPANRPLLVSVEPDMVLLAMSNFPASFVLAQALDELRRSPTDHQRAAGGDGRTGGCGSVDRLASDAEHQRSRRSFL